MRGDLTFAGPARRLPVSSPLRHSGQLNPDGFLWGNSEEAVIPSAAAIDGAGGLTITARRRSAGVWESGRLDTHYRWTVKYGLIEARMSCTVGQGVWPAVWLRGVAPVWPDGPEIDIVELGQSGNVSGAAHSWVAGVAEYSHQETTADAADGLMHTYAIDWAEDSIEWLYDGVPYGSLTPADLAPGDTWVFNQPMYLIVNLAMGGTFPGATDGTTPTPSQMVVDYVQVTQ